ncbi:hypothetical protein A5882_002586, partial [Enterococcus sp. 4E1_DIV0656]
ISTQYKIELSYKISFSKFCLPTSPQEAGILFAQTESGV